MGNALAARGDFEAAIPHWELAVKHGIERGASNVVSIAKKNLGVVAQSMS